MPTATSKLDILINAKDNASGTLKGIAGQADDLASTLSGGLGKALGVASIAALGTAAIGAATDMAKTAAQTERLETAFNSLAAAAGESGDRMLAAMQEASHGTISNAELMGSANRAMLLGVADSADEMSQLLEIAAARGKAMGESTSDAFSDLVTGLGRMSPMILDNLGITIDAESAFKAYADTIGKESDQLTDAEKKQALLNAVIADSTDIIAANKAAGDDAAANYERMDAALTNAKDALGELFSPAIAVIAQNLADAVNEVTDALSTSKLEAAHANMADLGKEITDLAQKYKDAELATHVALIRPEVMDAAQQELSNVKKELVAFGTEYNKAAAIAGAPLIDIGQLQQGIVAFAAAKAGVAALGDEALNTGGKLRVMGADALAAMESFNIAMNLAQGIATSIESAAASSGAFMAGKAGGGAGLAHQKEITDELQQQVDSWHEMGYTDKEISEVLLPGMVSSIREADSAMFKTAGSTKKLSDEAKEARDAFNDLKSAAASVLQGALDPGVGVDPDDVLASLGLPREDAINENARRLADIAKNGLKGQDWLDEFQKEVPDIWQMIRLAQNPQEEAARLLRDFQDGLLSSPIDKDKAKEIIRRQILGDQNMAELANEIATELATEMGIPLQEAMAATQKTMGGGSGLGSEAASQFADGADAALDAGGANGMSFVDKFIEQMKSRYSLLTTAGTEAGRMWGDAFLAKVGDNVPPALISMLTDLITPEVVARLAQRGTLTGATP